MKSWEERINIRSPMMAREIFEFDWSIVTFQAKDELSCWGVVTVCQLQDGSRTMTSVVQYAFMVLVNPGGKGTRYSN